MDLARGGGRGEKGGSIGKVQRQKKGEAGGLFLTDRCHLALAPSLRFVLGVVTRMVSAIFVRVHIMSALLAACR